MLKLFKKPRPKTAIHPVYKKLVERVASIDGRDLYQFKSLTDMPINRHHMCDRFSVEFGLRLDAQILSNAIDEMQKAINKGDVTKVAGILAILKEQTNMLISIESAYRLASCVYFWDNEDLTEYDFDIGDEKMKLFKKMKFDDFFLSEPINKFLPLMSLSAQDLEICLKIEQELKKLMSQTLNAEKLNGKLAT